MNTFTNFTGLAGIVLLIATAAATLFRAARIKKSYLILLTLAVVFVVSFPFGALPSAAYLRGIIGDLSITSVILLALALLKVLFGWRLFNDQKKWLLQSVIAISAAIFYPLTLGISYFDPYRLGFGNLWFLITLFILTLAAFYKRYFLLAFCITLAVLTWSVGWYESTNLWNYLLDPFVAVYAIGALIWRGGGMLRRCKSTFALRGSGSSPLS